MISNISVIAKGLKGAEYRTKQAYTYGRFEVRMKSANVEGMLSSFFTYFDGTETDPWSTSKWNEIDLEIMGRYDNNVQFNTITPNQVNHVGHHPVAYATNMDFHIYAFEWTPQYVAWFVDGTEVLRQTGSHISTLTRPQKIMMNVWNPLFANWAGTLNTAALPAFAYYDWVSYYSYTPGSGNYGTGNNFSLDWKDDFDSWDTARWDKATHTWDQNGCDFIQENAVFKNGNLILCLTNSTNIGYTDVIPPSIMWARASDNKVTVMFSEQVDKTTAENSANYVIPGVTINSAILRSDLKSVDLSVTGLEIPSSKNIAVLTMKDVAEVPNIMSGKATTIIMPQQLTFPIKINCAGSSALDYLQEQDWSPIVDYGSLDGTNSNYSSSLAINGTDEDIIYQSNRYNLVGYKVRVPNGKYDVKLLFSENYFSSTGLRVFDVYLEQNRVTENLDIIKEAGKNSALIKEYTGIQVNDEELDIQFGDKIDYALICGIIVEQNLTDVDENKDLGIVDFKVEQNYPNPFNGKTIINYSLSSTENVSFGLYNILGEQVFFEDLGLVSEGSHQYQLNTAKILSAPLTSGIYFYEFTTPQRRQVKKLVLLN